MKSSFLTKSIHRCGLAACGHCKEVTLSPHFLYKPAAEKREESRKETLIDKCDKKRSRGEVGSRSELRTESGDAI